MSGEDRLDLPRLDRLVTSLALVPGDSLLPAQSQKGVYGRSVGLAAATLAPKKLQLYIEGLVASSAQRIGLEKRHAEMTSERC